MNKCGKTNSLALIWYAQMSLFSSGEPVTPPLTTMLPWYSLRGLPRVEQHYYVEGVIRRFPHKSDESRYLRI